MGVAIVAASVLVGARLLGSADDTVPVWSVVADSAAGSVLGPDDVTVARVRFDGAGEAARYVAADTAWPGDLVLDRDVSAGELVPRSALASAGASPLSRLPLDFSDGGVAASLRRGDRVDVFVTSADRDARAAEVALQDVAVLDVLHDSGGLGGSGGVQVVLGVASRADLPRIVQAAVAGQVYLVARG